MARSAGDGWHTMSRMSGPGEAIDDRDDTGVRFGPRKLNLRIAPGVTTGHMLTLLFGSFFGIAMMGFINASQPYLFTEVLNVPTDEQGPLAGNLTFLSEIVVIAIIGLIGAMSDKLGRKPIWAGAFLIFSTSSRSVQIKTARPITARAPAIPWVCIHSVA